MNNEPVVTAASIAGLISAALMFMRVMGLINWTDVQFNSFMAFIVLALPIAGALWGRLQVTTLAAPKDNTGTPLVRASDGKPAVQ
jgi:hypothetical protein